MIQNSRAYQSYQTYQRLQELSHSAPRIRELFAANSTRGHTFSCRACDLYLDYSKNPIDADIRQALLDFAVECGLTERRVALFGGERINTSEDRAVLHAAWRNTTGAPMHVDGEDVMPEINRTLKKMADFAGGVRKGTICTAQGKKFRHLVHIGIGGSLLGPQMIDQALRYGYQGGDEGQFDLRFVGNVDPDDLLGQLRGVDLSTTLFFVVSKTFTTQETMANAHLAKRLLVEASGVADEAKVGAHFVAISSNIEATAAFGIDPDRVFSFADWVGGRYSLCSPVGLSLAVQYGSACFEQLRAGFHAMDRHFQQAPLHENMPVLLALIGFWHRSFLQVPTHLILPYAERLALLPDYLQQADMESNGKSVDLDNQRVDHATGPAIWGGAGTNAQHSFFQWLHQGAGNGGSAQCSSDFIGIVRPSSDTAEDMHHMLMANYFAQQRALAFGRTDSSDLPPYRQFEGNRSSNAILLPELTPKTLGSLIALYEHKIFCQGVFWNINSFDQWGVELGKAMASEVLPALSEPAQGQDFDSSTQELLKFYRRITMLPE